MLPSPAFPKVRYYMDVSSYTGYNNAARATLRALRTLGLGPGRVRAVAAVTPSATLFSDCDPELLSYLTGPWEGDDKINIVHLNPGMVGDYWGIDRYNIAYCSWETDSLPKREFTTGLRTRSVVPDLNRFDEVWVPTEHQVEVLQRSGVEKPIAVIPHAISTPMADLVTEKLEAKLATRPPIDQAHPFRFYFIGSWDARKNVEQLLEAYFKTGWTMNTPVRLSLHCVPAHRDPAFVHAASWKAQETFKLILESVVGAHAQVALLTLLKPPEWVVDMHLLGDCFVTASHGEGFCYPALDALYVGNAVIGGGGPAVKSLLASSDRDEEDRYVGALPMTATSITPMPECQGYEFGQKWWSVDTDDLANAMLDAFEAAHEREERTRLAREVRHAGVKRRFSYEEVGALIRARLEVAVVELAARRG